MNDLKALVLGASGLVGSQVLDQLLADPAYAEVRILVRRQLEISHPKLVQRVTNFSDLSTDIKNFGNADVIFCCVGTTQKKVAGDRSAYRKVDHDIPVTAAKTGAECGYTKYLLVSAVGASERSSNFYLKLKGETEKDVSAFSYDTIGIFQPSILLGNRMEVRPGEKLMQKMTKLFTGILLGSLKKYRAIDAREVAAAMIHVSKEPPMGIKYFTYADMQAAIS